VSWWRDQGKGTPHDLKTESRKGDHVLPKELKSNTMKGNIQGNARDIAKKAEANFSKGFKLEGGESFKGVFTNFSMLE